MKLHPSNTGIIKRLLVGRNNRPLRSILAKLEPADIASILNQLSLRESLLVVHALISIDKALDVLRELPDRQLIEILCHLDDKRTFHILTYAPEDEAAYFLSLASENEQSQWLSQLETPKRMKIQQYLSYPEDSAGRLMQTQVFCLPVSITAKQGLEIIRERARDESIYYIYCVNELDDSNKGKLIGTLSLRQLAIAPEDKLLSEIVKKEVVTVRPDSDESEVARLVSHYDFVALPVVDETNYLLGIITVDEILDVIQEQATANIYASAGLQEDDRVYSSAWESIKNRSPWMLLNLVLAAIASSVVALFEDTMAQLVILASLKNIVAGLGGNTAIQTLTVVTRGIATGDFSFISKSKAILKETIVGVTIGVGTGICAGILTYVWKQNLMVSIIICISMILNAMVASACGAVIPLVLKALNRDPAVGSGVIATMITDIFGFFSFLGIATLGLKYFT